MTLIEKLTVMAIIAILASILLVSLGKAALSAKLWIWGAYAIQEERLNAAADGNDKLLEYYCNQQTKKWTIVP